MTDTPEQDQSSDTTDDGALSPGSTATGGGTALESDPTLDEPDPGEIGTTEADVSDGREQKLPRHD